MKILVLGSKGQLGMCLKDQLANSDHEVTYTSRDQINIADPQILINKVRDISPEIVVNATAYTAVDKAEEDRETANLINHLAVANLASICNQLDCWLLHISTDYVFDGTSNTPYKENDRTNPQGVYGSTKLDGELAVRSSGCKHIIIRTSWVFSEYGENFFKTMLRLGAERTELGIVGDQIGCPTYAQDLASSIVQVLSLVRLKGESGTYHYCGNEACSWYDFALEIFSKANELEFKTPKEVKSVETSAYPTLAVRPAFSVLNCSKIQTSFGVSPSNWKVGIENILSKL